VGASSAVASDDARSFISSLVFVLALEGQNEPDPSWNTWQTFLDSVVQFSQPRPSITHVELVVPSMREGESMHFATYITERAGWGSSFNNNRSFYLGENIGNWRAIPISCTNAAERVRVECNKHVGTEYSIALYLCAVPPMRALASLLPDTPLSSAHCGTLTARVLKGALSETAPAHASAWYGPSTLFIEMSSDDVQRKTSDFLFKTSSIKSLVEQEGENAALHNLLHGSDDDVRTLSNEACCIAIRSLAERACNTELNDTARCVVQKQLATTLLRYSIINRS